MLASLAALLALAQPVEPGSVIFLHPDGTGPAVWSALRFLDAGPDGGLNWDRMSSMATYRGHATNSLTQSSNGGGTAHAYGVRPSTEAFGIDNGEQLIAASGKPISLLREVLESGLAGGVISSAAIVDAGTGVFLASVPDRDEKNEIAAQMLAAKPNVLLGGGEMYFLPEGTEGRHGEGARTDGRNLIEEAQAAGYTVVYTRDELASLPAGTTHVLGLFALDDTFNDETEETLRAEGRPLYVPTAPTVAEMTEAALQVLEATGQRFFLVVEEEGTDNFAGDNNAAGTLEAARRADAAIGVALQATEADPSLFLMVAADSVCGGLQVMSVDDPAAPLPPVDEENGSPWDGVDGTGTAPFLSAPDLAGNQFPFAIAWASAGDMGSGLVLRSHGYTAHEMPNLIDNYQVYWWAYRVLFGEWPAGSQP